MSAAPQLDGTLISHIVFTLFLSQNSTKARARSFGDSASCSAFTAKGGALVVVLIFRQMADHWRFSRYLHSETNHLVAAAQEFECQNARGSMNGGC